MTNVSIASAIGLGIGTKLTGGDSMPGWDEHSWGFHGDDGRKFHGSSRDTGHLGAYASPYGKRDTVECCFDASARTISFRKNGEDLGELKPISAYHNFLSLSGGANPRGNHLRQSLRERQRTSVSSCGHVQPRSKGYYPV